MNKVESKSRKAIKERASRSENGLPENLFSYLSAIGRRGGQKSKRTLTKAQARAMVAAREKKRSELCPLKKTK